MTEPLAPPRLRVLRDDGGVLRPATSPLPGDIADELARRSFVHMASHPHMSSYDASDRGEYAIWVKCISGVEYLIWLPGLNSYASFCKVYAHVAHILDRMLPY